MASTGESVSYAEYEARTNRLAHLLRARGLGRLDHYAIFMENNDRYLEACGAGERAGLYYTCVNSYLTAPELAYILNNSTSKLLITSRACRQVALEAARDCPGLTSGLIVDGTGDDGIFADFEEATRAFPGTPIADECLGTAMLYSSGTTGRPKGILRPLDDIPPSDQLPLFGFLSRLWKYREGLTYLSPAPLYHSAPQAAVNLAIRHGGTVIIMEKFDPEQYLRLVERYRVTHSQLVPTMFSRMLKLPERVRSRPDLASLEIAVHAAAPCPVPVKRQMIEWWGPVLLEYYASTEAVGFSACDSAEWLAHPGTVGKVVLGELHILDGFFQPVAPGTPGTLWFKPGSPFRYFDDVEKTAESTSPDGSMVTVGDIGYLDDDGYLYLTDRATFMVISGGVNIYPQECENLLITHPKVADAAVFGVPHEDLGEEVKAVIQLMPGFDPGPDTAAELIAFCREHLAHIKCPRSVDFTGQLPRLPTGKLYKKALRDRYWGESRSRIV
jgi:long-chain acyl-CoA synthetase